MCIRDRPYMWGTLGIVYNKSMVKDPVDSWDILWNDKYSRNILMFDSVRDTIGVSLKRLGLSMNSVNRMELRNAKRELIKQKPKLLAYVNDDGKDRMVAGEAALGIFYSGDVGMMKEENPDLEYVLPKEGSNIWTDGICIPKTADNEEWAEAFINFLCDPDVAARNTEYIAYSTPITEARKKLPEEMRNDPTLYPDKKLLEKCEAFLDLSLIHISEPTRPY